MLPLWQILYGIWVLNLGRTIPTIVSKPLISVKVKTLLVAADQTFAVQCVLVSCLVRAGINERDTQNEQTCEQELRTNGQFCEHVNLDWHLLRYILRFPQIKWTSAQET